MAKSRGSLGMGKHRKSGHAGKSPKLRMAETLRAAKTERKPRKTTTRWRARIKDTLDER